MYTFLRATKNRFEPVRSDSVACGFKRFFISEKPELQLTVQIFCGSVRFSCGFFPVVWTGPSNTTNAFRKLTYLLHVISSINSNDKDGSGFQYGGKARDEASESFQPLVNVTLLDSIVAILVQQYEVVAACYTSDMVSVVVAETDPNPSKATDIRKFWRILSGHMSCQNAL